MPRIDITDKDGIVSSRGSGVFLVSTSLSLDGKRMGQIVVELTTADAAGTVKVTGGSFPPGNFLITDLYVDITDAGTKLDVGVSSDTDGFFNGLDISSTGVYGPSTVNAVRGAFGRSVIDGRFAGFKLASTQDREITVTPDPDGGGLTSAGKVVFIFAEL